MKELFKKIESENGHQPSKGSQKLIAKWFVENEVAEHLDRQKRTSEVEDVLDEQTECEVSTCLKNLTRIDILTEVGSGGGSYIMHHRTGTPFWSGPGGKKFRALLQEEIERLLGDLEPAEKSAPAVSDGGSLTKREVIATRLTERGSIDVDPSPSQVEEAIQAPADPVTRMERLDIAVEAVEESDHVDKGANYEPMGWRNPANKYTLTRHWYETSVNASLDNF